MAIFEPTRPAPFGAETTYNIVRRLESVWGMISHWNQTRKTVSSLSSLSDHELEDIGLSRGDILRVASSMKPMT